MHLFGFFFFQISPFKINYKDSLFLPTFVATDLSSEEVSDIFSLTLEAQEKMPWYLQPPAAALPEINAILDSKIPLDICAWKECGAANFTLESMHKEIKMQTLSALFADPLPESSVSIYISGPLGASLLVQRQINEQKLTELIGKAKDLMLARRFIFKVQVDAHTGEVFWWDLAKKNGETYFLDCAITILNSLRFQLPSHTFMQKGEIEIAFNLCMLQM